MSQRFAPIVFDISHSLLRNNMFPLIELDNQSTSKEEEEASNEKNPCLTIELLRHHLDLYRVLGSQLQTKKQPFH